MFTTNSYLLPKKLFIKSIAESPLHHSKYSRFQEVSASFKQGYDNSWEIEAVDPNNRFELTGEPVRANGPILIKHCSTCHYLASDLVEYKNTHGTEYEVTVHSYATLNKSQNLALEFTGQVTRDVPSKFQYDQNIWKLVTAPDATYDCVDESNDESFKIETLLKEVKQKINTRSSFGLRGIGRIFRDIDQNHNGSLDVDDF